MRTNFSGSGLIYIGQNSLNGLKLGAWTRTVGQKGECEENHHNCCGSSYSISSHHPFFLLFSCNNITQSGTSKGSGGIKWAVRFCCWCQCINYSSRHSLTLSSACHLSFSSSTEVSRGSFRFLPCDVLIFLGSALTLSAQRQDDCFLSQWWMRAWFDENEWNPFFPLPIF